MPTEPSRTRSLWIDTGPVKRFPSLEGDIQVEVAVIGAGITGVTAADLLKRAGKSVALIDFHRVGTGESGHTTAHLTEVLDTDYSTLISNFGVEGARLACQSSRKAIQRIEANIQAHEIDCSFERVTGWKYTEDNSDTDYLLSEADAALRLSVPNTVTSECPLPFPVAEAIRFDHQAQFHPLHYVHALARSIPGDGSHVFELTRAIDIEEGEPCRVITERGTIRAQQVIIAANVPILNKFFLITKIAAYRTYALAFRPTGDWRSGSLFWDTAEPYHYIRGETINGQHYLVVGGEDHKTGKDEHTEIHHQRLEAWCRERFQFDAIDYRWSGQVINPVDGLPFIGHNSMSDRVYVATGFMGNGMTFGTVAGMLLSDLILKNPNPWADLYSATRVKPWASARTYLSENVDFPTKLIADRISTAHASDLKDLRENEGALVRVGGKKVATYRDPEGRLHMLSPVCPHLGCYVHWNNSEKSWDCPCHGSRFDPLGKLLNGPATADLKPEMVDEDLPFATVRFENQERPSEPFGAPILSFLSCPCKG